MLAPSSSSYSSSSVIVAFFLWCKALEAFAEIGSSADGAATERPSLDEPDIGRLTYLPPVLWLRVPCEVLAAGERTALLRMRSGGLYVETAVDLPPSSEANRLSLFVSLRMFPTDFGGPTYRSGLDEFDKFDVRPASIRSDTLFSMA